MKDVLESPIAVNAVNTVKTLDNLTSERINLASLENKSMVVTVQNPPSMLL